MHEPDLETACVALANELIVQLHVPYPRIQCVLEIGSTLFSSLFKIICGYLPNGVIEYPQSIEEEKKNLDLILDKFSTDFLGVGLPHIKSENVLSSDYEVIYYLLEIFKKYSTYFPPATSFVSKKGTKAEINNGDFIKVHKNHKDITTDNREFKAQQNNKLITQSKATQKSPIIPLKIPLRFSESGHSFETKCQQTQTSLSSTRVSSRNGRIYHSCPKCENTPRLASGSTVRSSQNSNRNITKSHQTTSRTCTWAKELNSSNSSPSDIDHPLLTSSSSDDSIVEQSLSSSVDIDLQSEPDPPLEVRFRPVSSQKRVRFQNKSNVNYQIKTHIEKNGKRNWKDGVVLCAETYGFKVPCALKNKEVEMDLNAQEKTVHHQCIHFENLENEPSDVVRKILFKQFQAQINRTIENSRKANYQRIQNFVKEQKIHSCHVNRQHNKVQPTVLEPWPFTENNRQKISKIPSCLRK